MARQVQDRDFPSLRDARPGLRDEVYAMFERCVARKPEERFPDARELLQVLRPLVQIDEAALADAESAARTEQVIENAAVLHHALGFTQVGNLHEVGFKFGQHHPAYALGTLL